MADLIDRQAAIDALIKLYEYQRDIDPTEAADLVRQWVFLAEKKIERLPSADAMEVRHGQWVPQVDKWGDIITTVDGYKCSECREFDTMKDKYCPNCGARMDGEQDG